MSHLIFNAVEGLASGLKQETLTRLSDLLNSSTALSECMGANSSHIHFVVCESNCVVVNCFVTL